MKLDSNLEVEWTEEFGECDGSDQLFDFVVDRLVPQKKSQKEEKYKKNSVTETLWLVVTQLLELPTGTTLRSRLAFSMTAKNFQAFFTGPWIILETLPKKSKKEIVAEKSTFLRLTERPTSKFGATLMGSQEASMPGVVGKNIWSFFKALAFIWSNPL